MTTPVAEIDNLSSAALAVPEFLSSMECVMSVKRFAIPSTPLRRGWTRADDYVRVVEAHPISAADFAAAQAEVGSVYFIADQISREPIKIGWSRDSLTRLQQLQVGNHAPLQIIGCVAATRLIEPALHDLFSPASISGEWFADPEGSIQAWLKEMTFGSPIERCRFYMAGTQSVSWIWDEKALIHRPIFSDTPE